jgi:hypothetical protein
MKGLVRTLFAWSLALPEVPLGAVAAKKPCVSVFNRVSQRA